MSQKHPGKNGVYRSRNRSKEDEENFVPLANPQSILRHQQKYTDEPEEKTVDSPGCEMLFQKS